MLEKWEKSIKYSIAGRIIEDAECFDVHIVIQEGVPHWLAPSDVVDKPDFVKKCLLHLNNTYEESRS